MLDMKRERELKTHSGQYVEPAMGVCDCGEEVELDDPMTNECACGRLYNGSGQELNPPDQWEEPWDAE